MYNTHFSLSIRKRNLKKSQKKKEITRNRRIRGAICVQTGRKKAPELRNAPTSRHDYDERLLPSDARGRKSTDRDGSVGKTSR